MKFTHNYKAILLILLSMFSHTISKAQKQDSLVCYDDLTFNTVYKKQLFLRLLSGKEINNFMPFFIASSIKSDISCKN